MTERLYYRDATLLEFDAHVIGHAGDPLHAVLDRTAFYPTSGGQPHDTGTLGATRVVDVIDEDDRIIHVTSAPLPLGPVRGAVDGARRRDLMQQHSAQHLLSALAADRMKWETASVHFGAEHSTIEFTATTVTDRQIADLEQWANDLVAEARAVTVSFEDAAAAEAEGLRKASGRSGEIRVITIAAIDRSACGGTHVSRTSEIGPVLLTGMEKVRGNHRVGFLAGNRALAHARAGDATLAVLARQLGCAVSEIETLVASRQADLKTARDQVTRLELEVAASRLRALFDAATPGPDGFRRINHHAPDESPAVLRAMAQGVGSLGQTLFTAIGGSPPTIYFATSGDSGVDAAAALKPALAAAGGRGGGSARVAQGTAASTEILGEIAGAMLTGS